MVVVRVLLWAYAGSNAHLNVVVLVCGPILATIAIFLRRLRMPKGMHVMSTRTVTEF